MIGDDVGQEGGLLSDGYTLIEVVIAMLLLLIVSSGIMGAVLAGRKSVGSSSRRASAAQAARRVSEALKAYWVADTSVVAGPGNAPNGWGLPGDPCACWAFDPGTHALDAAVWAPDLAAAGGSVSYTVSRSATALGDQPSVTFNVTWAETAAQ